VGKVGAKGSTEENCMGRSQRDHDEQGKTDAENERLNANISIEELSRRRKEQPFSMVNKEFLP
jgi:hypothetical protein